jgi:hypothetical protein
VVREWDLEEVRLGDGTVRVMVRVYAGIDVEATLDGGSADEVISSNLPILEYLFRDVTPEEHTVEVRDVVGFDEPVTVTLPDLTATLSPGEKPTAEGLCVSAVPLALFVGDSWILEETVHAEGEASEGIPTGAVKWSGTFEVIALDDASLNLGTRDRRSDETGTVLVENVRAELRSTLVWRDAAGEVLATEEEMVAITVKSFIAGNT